MEKLRYTFNFSPEEVVRILTDYNRGMEAYSRQEWERVSGRFEELHHEAYYFMREVLDAPWALHRIASATGKGPEYIRDQLSALHGLASSVSAAASSAEVSDPLVRQVVRDLEYNVRWLGNLRPMTPSFVEDYP
ncbi:hypothetical protein HYY74_08255 [Candidatus Woesearchaeota archaeon]|nr:hypothetical protein [Candidatus Woesearchaeota archaeon]